jgi:hypothetical protein
MLSHPDWYLDTSGNLKSFEQIRGFRDGAEQEFHRLEMKINAALGATKVAAVCTYRAAVTADEFVAIVTARQDALDIPHTCS